MSPAGVRAASSTRSARYAETIDKLARRIEDALKSDVSPAAAHEPPACRRGRVMAAPSVWVHAKASVGCPLTLAENDRGRF